MKIQNYINHIALVVDGSGSMAHLKSTVVKVFDSEIAHLRERSVALKQETRISIYVFNTSVECVVFDMDVMRMGSIKEYYDTFGGTALIDATASAVADMKKLPELYGDHAFLVYVITDGEENASRATVGHLSGILKALPEHWTVACLVPDAKGMHEAKKFGFPSDNVQIWSTTGGGLEEVGRGFRSAMSNYMDARAKGVRGTKSLFTLDATNLNKSAVKSKLAEIHPNSYSILHVRQDESVIKPFVETWGMAYRVGSAYYELVKPEIVQPQKFVCVQETKTGKVYEGTSARELIGLPAYEVKVNPVDHPDWRIFVQSTSVNRKLPKGTQVLVMK